MNIKNSQATGGVSSMRGGARGRAPADKQAYPIDQLQRYLTRQPHDIPNVQTARIFTSYIHNKVDELKQMAAEIDESYGAF